MGSSRSATGKFSLAKPTPDADYLGIVDPYRRRLLNLIKDRNLDMKAVSKRMGRNSGYIREFLVKGSPRTLGERDRGALARILGISEELLRQTNDTSATESSSYILDQIAVPAPGARDLPVYGNRLSDDLPSVDFQMGIKGLIERPAQLAGFTDAFAFFMPNDTMSPVIRVGEACYCNPIKPLTEHCLVLLQFMDDRGAAYEYLGQSGGAWRLRLYGASPQDLEIAATEVKRFARITLHGDPS